MKWEVIGLLRGFSLAEFHIPWKTIGIVALVWFWLILVIMGLWHQFVKRDPEDK